MKPEEIARTYDALAAHWNGPDFWRENGMRQHRQALQFVGDKGRALDVGCGSSGRIIDWLIDSGFEVEGIDVSAEMVRLAEMRHPEVRFHHADICEWEPSATYNFISAWDCIWHVPLERQEPVVRKLCGALAKGGVLILTCGGLDGPEERREIMKGQPIYHATPGIPRLLEIIADSGCICRHLEYDQWPEQHVFLVAQRTVP